MSWQPTLVAPPDPAVPHLVVVSCRWCSYQSAPLDVRRETGRAWVRHLRKAHDCREIPVSAGPIGDSE